MPTRRQADEWAVCSGCCRDIGSSSLAIQREPDEGRCDHVLCVACLVPATLNMLRTVPGNGPTNAARRASLIPQVEAQFGGGGELVALRVPCPFCVALGACGDNCTAGEVDVTAIIKNDTAKGDWHHQLQGHPQLDELRFELLLLADATPEGIAVRDAQRPCALEQSATTVGTSARQQVASAAPPCPPRQSAVSSPVVASAASNGHQAQRKPTNDKGVAGAVGARAPSHPIPITTAATAAHAWGMNGKTMDR